MTRAPVPPEGQFQIGDKVLYKPEGVFAEVRGYLWDQEVNGVATIAGYDLDVGITVPAQLIEVRK